MERDNTSIIGWLGISLPFHLPTSGMTACRHPASPESLPQQTFHTARAAHRVTNLAFPEPRGVWLMYLLYQNTLCPQNGIDVGELRICSSEKWVVVLQSV